jgi:hypothetical protein
LFLFAAIRTIFSYNFNAQQPASNESEAALARSNGVMRGKSAPLPEYPITRSLGDAYNEADWVDWDHWQAVEEMRDFLDGVHDRPEAGDPFDPREGDAQVARQLRRYGLQADG